MDKKSENRFFLLIKKNKITITVLSHTKEFILTKEIFFKNYSLNEIYNLLENFLDKNILQIEKDLKIFIKNINIIFESDNFFLAETSIKQKFKINNINQNQIKDSLIDIRSQFDKYSPGYEIIHMVINKYLVDGHVFKSLPENIYQDNLVIQIDFVCLDNQIIQNLKDILSRYQISINKILSYDYLRKLYNPNNENIIKIANDNIDGFYANEVLMAEKTSKNQSFFEKFFNYFS